MINNHRSNQKGSLLISLAIGLVVIGLIMVGVTRQAHVAAERASGKTRGAALDSVAKAADLYRTTNLAALSGEGNTAAGAAPVTITGIANVWQPTVSELIATGYLATPVSIPDGRYSISLAKAPAGCIAPADNPCTVWASVSLVAPVLSPNGRVNGPRIDSLIQQVSVGQASYSMQPNPSQITGGAGSWSIPNPDAGNREGIVAVVLGIGGGGEPWLRVGDTRNPMFAGPSVTGPQFDTDLKVVGSACTPQGAFASAANGLVYCNAGIWTIYSGEIVTGGAACTEEGAMGVTAAGASLMCINAAWRDHKTLGIQQTAYYAHGSTVDRPTCGVGLTGIAVISSTAASVIIGTNNPGNNTGSYEAAIDPTTWLVSITGSTGVVAGNNSKALVVTSCVPT